MWVNFFFKTKECDYLKGSYLIPKVSLARHLLSFLNRAVIQTDFENIC